MPACVSRWTATRTLINTATSLRLTAARTTSTASATCSTRRHTLLAPAETSGALILTDAVIITMSCAPIIGTWVNAIMYSAPIIVPTAVQECSTTAPVIAIMTVREEKHV